jgi:hypothetical protein
MQMLIDIGLSIIYFCLFLLLCAWTWRFWMMYVNQKHLASLDWVMLEIKLPREIAKSPLATEMALGVFLQTGGIGTTFHRNFKGNLPIYSSLEIASLEGVIHFYIRTQRKFKNLVESTFYAQYPEIEIVEADDYTNAIRYHHLSKDVSFWGASYSTSKKWKPTNEKTGKKFSIKEKDSEPPKDDDDEYEMKADFYPIKTYVDYGLDKDPKEEYKIDPLVPLLETMGGLTKGEYMWYQVLLMDEGVCNGKRFPKFYVNERAHHKHLSLKELADARKKQIRTTSWNIKDKAVVDEFGVPKIINVFKGEDEDYEQQFTEIKDDTGKVIRKEPKTQVARHKETKAVLKEEVKLTQDEKDELEIINKKLSKPLAMCVIRLIYVAKKENANVGSQVQNIIAFPKPFAGMNSLSMSPSDPYMYPWQTFGGKRPAWRGEEMFEAFVEREGFFPHIKERKGLDSFEDRFFWTSSMKQRKLFRMIFEAILYPFDHPHAEEVSTLNLEEVATLWHLPGATAATPTLPRIDSNKGVAPVNLPL